MIKKVVAFDQQSSQGLDEFKGKGCWNTGVRDCDMGLPKNGNLIGGLRSGLPFSFLQGWEEIGREIWEKRNLDEGLQAFYIQPKLVWVC